MARKIYIIPEVQQVSMGMPKSICQAYDSDNHNHISAFTTDNTGGMQGEAPGRVKLYF